MKNIKTKKPEKTSLTAKKRTVTGKKVKQLRKQGIIPANVFGRDFKSMTISVVSKEFIPIFKKVKETGVVYIEVEKESIPTLIKNVQKHPLDRSVLHVDFIKVDLTQKITTLVPVAHIGNSEAVTQKGGVLLTQSTHLNVEALPENIPQSIEVEISSLKELGNEIKVKDMLKSDKYMIKEEAEKVIFSVIAHKEESVTPEVTVETPEVITEVPKEGETEAGAETEVKPEAPKNPPTEKKQEKKQEKKETK